MRKRKVWLLAGVILVVAFLAVSFLRFNKPGTEKLPWLVPKADRSDVGKTVTLSFEELCLEAKGQAVYIYNPKENTGRLAVFGGDTQGYTVVPVTIYDVPFRGGEDLCGSVSGTFEAKILEIVNIDFVEGMHFSNHMWFSEERLNQMNREERIHISDFSGMDTGNAVQYYFLRVFEETDEFDWEPLGEACEICITGGPVENASETFEAMVEKFRRIASRYGLKAELNL